MRTLNFLRSEKNNITMYIQTVLFELDSREFIGYPTLIYYLFLL